MVLNIPNRYCHLELINHTMLSSVSYQCLALVVCVSSQSPFDRTGTFSSHSYESHSSSLSYPSPQGMHTFRRFWTSSSASQPRYSYDPTNNFQSYYPHSLRQDFPSLNHYEYRLGRDSPALYSPGQHNPGQYSPEQYGPRQYSSGQFSPERNTGTNYPYTNSMREFKTDISDTETDIFGTETDIPETERNRYHTEFDGKYRSVTNGTFILKWRTNGYSREGRFSKYAMVTGRIYRERVDEYDTSHPLKSENEAGSTKNLVEGDPGDVQVCLLGHRMIQCTGFVFPMHPSTWEVWKTKVVKPIYNWFESTIYQCDIVLHFFYEAENDTRPNGFQIMMGYATTSGEFRQLQFLVKGYVSNPSSKFNENVVVTGVLSSPRCTWVVNRADRYCITSVRTDTGIVARYELMHSAAVWNNRSKYIWSEAENTSTPATIELFKDLDRKYRTNSTSVPSSLRRLENPVDPIPDSIELTKTWRTKFEIPFVDILNGRMNMALRQEQKDIFITLHPTYDGDSVTPSGLYITGSLSDEEILRAWYEVEPGNIHTYIPIYDTYRLKLPSFSSERPQNKPLTGCQLPPKRKGSEYRIGDCKPNQRDGFCEKEPGSWMEEYTQINYECNEGYVPPRIDDVNRTDSYCLDGEWRPEIRCQKKCGPLISPSHDIRCKYYGKTVSCTEEVFPDTVAKAKCKPHFHALDPVQVYAENACLADGNWEYDLFDCIPDCGLSNTTYRFRVSNGDDVRPGDYPWGAGLFWKKNGTFKHFCGGSIINSNLILTAAHCVYDEDTGMNHDPSDIIVAVGKFNISWDIIDAYEERINVLRMNKQSSYGRSLNSSSYFDDIAVIELSMPINFSEFRLPVCLDWGKRGLFRNGTLGTMVGWGEDESHHPSNLLQCAVLPYLDTNTCREMCPEFFREHMLPDKFCVGSGEDYGTSAQPGDSGGGFTFIRYKFHFLYGVLSIRPQYHNTFALYTNVTQKMDWLRKWAKTWPAPY